MPHITIEYCPPAVDKAQLYALIDAITDVVRASDVISLPNLKLRAIPLQHFRVADCIEPFVHISLAMMKGPPEEKLSIAADQLHKAAADLLPHIAQVTVDIRQTDPKTYRKRGQ